MCGIFGWAGKNPNKFEKSKFDVLGIFNVSRGKHSCGISVDGDIIIGIDDNKIYTDFIYKTGYDSPRKLPYAIGHTRHATYGSHNIYNAHPFGYGDITKNDNRIYEFIGVHNGSLEDYRDLATSRKIDISVETKINENSYSYRTKIDSEILLECIYKDKNFKVLSEYTGAAALIFINTNEPNVIYCYHGKSKEDNWVNSKIVEERPLYYYKETKNSLYISSIPESLTAIGATDKSLGEFEHNTVYKITDGDISNAVKIKINRTDRFQKKLYHQNNLVQNNCNFDSTPKSEVNIENKAYKKNKKISKIVNSNENIYDEKVDQNAFGNKIYFESLRYYRTGHLINGVYCYIKKYNNIVYMGANKKESEEYFWSKVNKGFADGMFLSSATNKNTYIPFPHKKGNEIISAPEFLYFFDGIRVKDEIDYQACLESRNQKRHWGHYSLSCASSHPIIDISKYKDKTNQGVILNNEPFSGTICPLLSDKIYTFKNGNLISWKYRPEKEDNFIKIDNLNEVFDDISKDSEDDTFLKDRLEKEIEEIFTGPYKKYPSILKQLERYSHLEKGKQVISLLEDFIEGMSDLITIEQKE